MTRKGVGLGIQRGPYNTAGRPSPKRARNTWDDRGSKKVDVKHWRGERMPLLCNTVGWHFLLTDKIKDVSCRRCLHKIEMGLHR